MRFTVLGSGTAKPDAQRGPAGFLVEHDGARILVDGGSGTLQRLARVGVDATTLDAGVYSHRHIDHTGDLVPLLFAMCVPPKRKAPYRIWAGAGFADFHQSLSAIYGKWIAPPGGVAIVELPLDAPGRADLPGGVSLITQAANHSAGALHLRFDAGGRSVVFSGDTGLSDALGDLAEGADLLVTECAGADHNPIEGHLWPAAIRDMLLAMTSPPGQVWLTHFYADVDETSALETVGQAGVAVRRAADGDSWT